MSSVVHINLVLHLQYKTSNKIELNNWDAFIDQRFATPCFGPYKHIRSCTNSTDHAKIQCGS